MEFPLNSVSEKVDFGDEAQSILVLTSLIEKWDDLKDADFGLHTPDDLVDFLFRFEDHRTQRSRKLTILGLDLDELSMTSKRLRAVYRDSLPDPLKKLLSPINRFTEKSGAENTGLLSWKALNASKQTGNLASKNAISFRLSGGVRGAIEIEAGDVPTEVFESDGIYLRFGLSGELVAGANVKVPFQFGSVSAGASADADANINYWFNIPSDRRDELFGEHAAHFLKRVPSPLVFDDIWKAREQHSLAAMHFEATMQFNHQIDMSIQVCHAMEGLAKGLSFEFKNTVARDRLYDILVRPRKSSELEGKQDLVLRVQRKRSKSVSSSRYLGLEVDLSEIAKQVQITLKPYLQQYDGVLAEYKDYLTPGILLRTRLADRLNQFVAELQAEQEIVLLVKAIVGTDSDVGVLSDYLKQKAIEAADSASGLFTGEIDEVVDELIEGLEKNHPQRFSQKARAKLVEASTSLLEDVNDNLKAEIAEKTDDLNGLIREVKTFGDPIRKAVNKETKQLDKAFVGVRTLLSRVDRAVRKITGAVEKATKAKLTMRLLQEERSLRGAEAYIELSVKSNTKISRSLYRNLIIGDFQSIEAVLQAPPPGIQVIAGSMEHFLEKHQKSGFEVGILGLELAATSIVESSLNISYDNTGNVYVESKLSQRKILKGIREKQEVGFFSHQAFHTAGTIEYLPLRITASQEDTRLESGELKKFLDDFCTAGLISQATFTSALDQYMNWSERADRKDIRARVEVSMALDKKGIGNLFEYASKPEIEIVIHVLTMLDRAKVYSKSAMSKSAKKISSFRKYRKLQTTEDVYMNLKVTKSSHPSGKGLTQFFDTPYGPDEVDSFLGIDSSHSKALRRARDVFLYAKSFTLLMRSFVQLAEIAESAPDLLELEKLQTLQQYCLARWIKSKGVLWFPSDDLSQITICFIMLITNASGLFYILDDDESVMTVTMTLMEGEAETVMFD